MEKLLTVAEVAAIIGISKTTIRLYIHRKVIKAEKRLVGYNHQWMIPSSQVEIAREYAGVPKDDFSNIDLELLEETSRFKQKLDPEMVELAEKLIRGEITVPQMVQSIHNKKEPLKSPEISVKTSSGYLSNPDKHNWIFIGDLHEPFCDPNYFEFIKELIDKYSIDRVVYLGDIIDNHALSYHEADPNLFSAGTELKKAKEQLQKWHELTPEAYVCLGNHDRLHKRKSKTAGLPSDWVRDIEDVLELPGWTFTNRVVTDTFEATHGDAGGSNMKNKILNGKDHYQGHLHGRSELLFYNGGKLHTGQCGCGVDKKSPAFAYAGLGADNFINSAIVRINGHPYMEIMK